MEKLADISEPQVTPNEQKISINSTFHLFIQFQWDNFFYHLKPE